MMWGQTELALKERGGPKPLSRQQNAILHALRQEPRTNIWLNENVCFAYSQRIGELIRKGYKITRVHVGGAVHQYTLDMSRPGPGVS